MRVVAQSDPVTSPDTAKSAGDLRDQPSSTCTGARDRLGALGSALGVEPALEAVAAALASRSALAVWVGDRSAIRSFVAYVVDIDSVWAWVAGGPAPPDAEHEAMIVSMKASNAFTRPADLIMDLGATLRTM